MRHRRWLAAAAVLLLLAGCGASEETSPVSGELPVPSRAEAVSLASDPAATLLPSDAPAPETTRTDADPTKTEPPETGSDLPTPSEGETEPPAPTVPPAPEVKPRVLSMGLYTGPFPEDGTDEAVDSVAVLLVENAADVQLQYAELHYRIDDREAVFRVSELPPGERAMAVEIHRLVATPVSVWEATPDSDLTVYLASEPEERLEVRREEDGVLTVVNRGTEAADADLYYKLRNEEGVFTGGIAYHVRVPDLAPGESRAVNAAHYTADAVLVRAVLREPEAP